MRFNSSGDSSAEENNVITVKKTVINSLIIDMAYNANPLRIVEGVSGKIIMPISLILVSTYALTTESSSFDLRVGWDGSLSTTNDYWGTSRDWMNGVSSGSITTCFGGTDSASSLQIMTFSLTDSPFQIWSTGAFNGGWTMEVYFSYILIDA